ncbi:MAG: hypothetical protein BRC25_01435 [Parcubacteria group bacterium SW_6_46_9]|nr:MAG: hypothetical protein BRC25_01435 [Parcubacteria group bacterium SW_6_46_9]
MLLLLCMRSGKKLVQAILMIMIVALLPAAVSAQENEQGVRSATIDAELQPDGSLLVTEKLQYDIGSVPQTGFVRRLTAPANGSIAVNSVIRDGLDDDFATTQAGSVKRVIIGTEGVEITGEHNYEISYDISNVLARGSDLAQLTWTVFDNTRVAAENITINFSSPLNISSVVCRIEPNEQGCPVEKTSGSFTVTLDELPSGKSLVLQATLPADQLSYDPPSADDGENTWFWLLVFGIMLAGGCFAMYWWVLADDEGDNQQSMPEHIDSLS